MQFKDGNISGRFRQTPFWTAENSLENEEDTHSQAERFWSLTFSAYTLIAVLSIVGITALWSPYASHFFRLEYISKDNTDYQEDAFQQLVLSLLVSVIWPHTYYIIRRVGVNKLKLGGISTVYDIIMIIADIYYPTVCCMVFTDQTHDSGVWVDSPLEVIAVVCGFLIALLHLIMMTIRVISFMIYLHYEGQFSPLGRIIYTKGYSTDIAVYLIAACISMIGFSMMWWTYCELGPKDYETLGLYALISYRPLTILLITPSIWCFTNLLSILHRSRAFPKHYCQRYDASMGFLMSCISLFCYIVIDQPERDSWKQSIWGSWSWVKPRNMAAITMAFITSLIHISLALNRLRPRFESEKNVDKINALIHKLTDGDRAAPFLSNDQMSWTEEELISLLEIKTLDNKTQRYIRFALSQIEGNHMNSRIPDPRTYPPTYEAVASGKR